MNLRIALHLLLVCALVPGVLLPGSAQLCLCSAMECGGCDGCAVVRTAHRSCCATKSPAPAGPSWSTHRHCRGCVVMTAARHESPPPRAAADDGAVPPALPVPITAGAGIVLHELGAFAPEPWPVSNAPPDRARSLPLVI